MIQPCSKGPNNSAVCEKVQANLSVNEEHTHLTFFHVSSDESFVMYSVEIEQVKVIAPGTSAMANFRQVSMVLEDEERERTLVIQYYPESGPLKHLFFYDNDDNANERCLAQEVLHDLWIGNCEQS